MKLYCQKDDRWANDKIGPSNLTVGQAGCTLSCVSMLSTAWNNDNGMDPGEVASMSDWFTLAGLILWGKLKVHGLKFEGRVYFFDAKAVESACKSENRAVMVEVLTPWKYADGSPIRHWVIGIKRTLIGGWRIADPLTGLYRDMPSTYKPIGAAYFSRI